MVPTEGASPEDRIRERAYRLWEKSGKPDGRRDHFWQQAVAELEAEDGSPANEGSMASGPEEMENFSGG